MTAAAPTPHHAPAPAPWLLVVGCLPDGTLAPTAPANVLAPGAVFGAARMLEAAGVEEARCRPWPKPFADGVEAVLARSGQRTVVLASGDPLHHGVAATLLRTLAPEDVAVFPAPSAFSLAAAAMRWPLEDVRCISLHTAPAAAVLGSAAPRRKLLCLTRDGETPQQIAAALTPAGYGGSTVSVLENLGTADEARYDSLASALSGTFAPLNVVAVDCRKSAPIAVAALSHDGCVTRDEVRLLTIAALGHGSGHLWDVGAGSGAVAIDWVRAGGSATLFEKKPSRIEAIHRNLDASGVIATVLAGEAADGLSLASPPDRVFHGGGIADDALFRALWAALMPGGPYVANAVTLGGEAALMARHSSLGGSLTRIALSHAAPVGRLTAMRPAMAVLQWRAIKP